MKRSKSQSLSTSSQTIKESIMKTTKRSQSRTEIATLPETVTPPPANLVIPSPPTGWGDANASQYRGVKPNALELTTLEDAVDELARFTDYPETLGKTAPPYDSVLSMFDAASKWSTMRSASAAWDNYCAVQEGIVWSKLRDQIARIKPAFALALMGDPSIAMTYTKLSSLLGARTTIARKGATTRRLNKQAVAEGKPPTHGVIGKQRQRAANKVLVEKAAQIASAAGASSSTAKTDASAGDASQPTGPTQAAQPVSSTATQPAVNAGPVNGASVLNGSNGAATNGSNGSNGAAHA